MIVVNAHEWMGKALVFATDVWQDSDGQQHITSLGSACVALGGGRDLSGREALGLVGECLMDMAYDQSAGREAL